jgi:phage tail-like protein
MGRPTDNYLGAANFRIFVSGINDPMDGFIKMSGLKATTEEMKFKHGMDTAVRHGAGRHDYEDIVLERAYSGVSEFYNWRKRIEAGVLDLRTMTIQFLDNGNNPRATFILGEAWPFLWEMDELDSGVSKVAIERITIAYEMWTVG